MEFLKKTCEKPYPSEEVMIYAKKAKKKHSSPDKPISYDMMYENLLADLLEGVIFVLVYVMLYFGFDILKEAKSKNLDKEIIEYLDLVIEEIEKVKKKSQKLQKRWLKRPNLLKKPLQK